MKPEVPDSLTVARLPELVGRRFAPGEWIVITQQRIDAFAECTGDHQFIHVDPERVRLETPFPGTLAHGYLLLSLVAGVRQANFPSVEDAGLVLNYGIDRLRFINPVFAGASVRYVIEVAAVEPKGGGRMLIRQNATLEVLGQPEPAIVAQLLAMYVPRAGGSS
jgi:acyl dehydratase